MSITDDLIELNGNKSDIQDALVAKGVTSAEKHGFNKFAEDIASITNQYTSSDEGKVVSSGDLVAQTAYPTTITENGTYNTTENNSITVNVPTSNYIIVPCNYDASITDETYYKDTPQLIIDTVNKTVQLIVNFNRKTGYSSVYTVITPTIPLSEIFDSQTVFTMQYEAIGTHQSTSGGGTYYHGVSAQTTTQYFIINILNNTITINQNIIYLYGGLTAYMKWTYQ